MSSLLRSYGIHFYVFLSVPNTERCINHTIWVSIYVSNLVIDIWIYWNDLTARIPSQHSLFQFLNKREYLKESTWINYLSYSQ